MSEFKAERLTEDRKEQIADAILNRAVDEEYWDDYWDDVSRETLVELAYDIRLEIRKCEWEEEVLPVLDVQCMKHHRLDTQEGFLIGCALEFIMEHSCYQNRKKVVIK